MVKESDLVYVSDYENAVKLIEEDLTPLQSQNKNLLKFQGATFDLGVSQTQTVETISGK